jgi:hypothetical protein
MTNPVWIAGGIGMFAIGAGGLEISMALTGRPFRSASRSDGPGKHSLDGKVALCAERSELNVGDIQSSGRS